MEEIVCQKFDRDMYANLVFFFDKPHNQGQIIFRNSVEIKLFDYFPYLIQYFSFEVYWWAFMINGIKIASNIIGCFERIFIRYSARIVKGW